MSIVDGGSQNISSSKTVMDNDLEDETFDDDVGLDALSEGTDEEYIPSSSPTGIAVSGHRPKRRNHRKTLNKEKEDNATKESRKGSVQCPTCHKTFLSKYYLKVHNR